MAFISHLKLFPDRSCQFSILDDGFDGWVPTAEFNEYFKIWLEKFKRTMGESWDENIIND